jgi:hypothetical protein
MVSLSFVVHDSWGWGMILVEGITLISVVRANLHSCAFLLQPHTTHTPDVGDRGHHQSSSIIINHRSSIIDHQSSIIDHQSSIINHTTAKRVWDLVHRGLERVPPGASARSQSDLASDVERVRLIENFPTC